MYDGHGIGAPGTRALEALEAELERPIRVLNGRGRTETVPEWTAEQRRACGNVTAADARERGITIFPYGSLHTCRYRDALLPPELMGTHYAETYPDGYQIYDVLAPQGEYHLAEPYEFHGVLFGEVGERVVAFHYPWTNWARYDNEQDNLLNSVDWLVESVKASVDEEALAAMRQAWADRARREFATYVRRASDVGTDDLVKEIGRMQTQLSQHVTNVARLQHDLRIKQRHLDAMLDNGDYEQQLVRAQESWDRLQSDERIENITFVDGNLILDTIGLDITHPITKVSAYLGKFRWTIHLESTVITVQNLDNAKGGYDHPHVHGNNPCFGEMGNTVHTLIRQGLFAEAVELIFAFLRSVNLHDDWSRRASFWLAEAMEEAEQEQTAEAVTA